MPNNITGKTHSAPTNKAFTIYPTTDLTGENIQANPNICQPITITEIVIPNPVVTKVEMYPGEDEYCTANIPDSKRTAQTTIAIVTQN